MLTHLNAYAPLGSLVQAEVTPGDMEADFSAPWLGLFDDAFGWIVATVLFIFAIVMVVGLAMWATSKLGGSPSGQDTGLKVFGIGLVCAVLASITGAAIDWATDLGPGWFDF